MKVNGIYLSRAISAFCLFLILAQANVWLDPLNNTILVLGYRLFILFTPICFLFFKNRLTFFAFALAVLGIILWLGHEYLIGTILIASGLAVSGYMLKYYSAFTAKGAAGNKIALNVGSMLSGLAIVLSQNKHLLLLLCAVLILLSLFSFYRYYRLNSIKNFQIKNQHFFLQALFSFKGVAWLIVGGVIGVKLISLMSVLPQFLIASHDGKLPHWYGWMLILNCLIIIFFQLPIMKMVGKQGRLVGIAPLFLAMLLVGFAQFFGLTHFGGAVIWVCLLSFIECAVSYLDKLAQDDGCLLLKESAVGIGSAATVYFVRYLDPSKGSLLVGGFSLLALMMVVVLFYFDSKKNSNSLKNPL